MAILPDRGPCSPRRVPALPDGQVLTVWSGGQTGADRGALEAAQDLCATYDGWVPKGRRAEDGKVPEQFKLREMQSTDYKRRTWANVRDTQATVIVCTQPPSGGSKLTIRYCREQERKILVLDAARVVADPAFASELVMNFVRAHKLEVLNVAGSRESRCPGLQRAVRIMLKNVLGVE